MLQLLGEGEVSQVYAARRIGALPLLATLKVSGAPAAAVRYAREAQVLRELQSLPGADAAYFTQRLPQVLAHGAVGADHSAGDNTQHALVLRYANGYWGSLAALNSYAAQGLDARHAVWIWRRMLDVLDFIHRQNWCHGDVRPEHALVHPQDHGVLLIGWASAHAGASAKDKARDIMHSARTIKVLLIGTTEDASVPHSVPTGLAQLIAHASEDIEFCRLQGAAGLDKLLKAAAAVAFGAPQFVPLKL
ncbi:MAG: serine/threonine-protein kinase [Burkholderiales bacterium]